MVTTTTTTGQEKVLKAECEIRTYSPLTSILWGLQFCANTKVP